MLTEKTNEEIEELRVKAADKLHQAVIQRRKALDSVDSANGNVERTTCLNELFRAEAVYQTVVDEIKALQHEIALRRQAQGVEQALV